MGEVENFKLDLPSARKELALFLFLSKFRWKLEVKRYRIPPLQISQNRLALLFQLNGLPPTGQLVRCQLTALTKKDLLNTDSFHLH